MVKKKLLSFVISAISIFAICLSFVIFFLINNGLDENNKRENTDTKAVSVISETATEEEKGGAIYVEPGSTYTMFGGVISGKNTTYGGAVFIGEGATFIMKGGIIEECSASYGGAIFVSIGATCIIDGGKIKSCSSTLGGALFVENSGVLNIQSVEIDACSATDSGGGIYGDNIKFDMSGGKITNCNASNYGGALYIGGTVNIDGGHIGEQGKGNSALIRGGGMFITSGTVNITGDSYIVGNKVVSSSSSSGGGGVNIASAQFNIGTSTKSFSGVIAENTVTYFGGAFFVGAGAVINHNSGIVGANIHNGIEYGPNSSRQGGAAFIYSGYWVKENVKAKYIVNGGSVTNNKASTGGAFYIVNSIAEFISGKVSFNTANSGGAVHMTADATKNEKSTFIMSGGEMCENVAINGGAIGTKEATLIKISGNALISKNFCSNGTEGGAIKNNGLLEIDGAIISENSAIIGGGIYNAGTAVIKNATILENIATQNGGGIYNIGTLTIQNVLISKNQAQFNGGGILSEQNGVITIEQSEKKSTIVGNSAVYGGGIYSRRIFSIYDMNINENSATYGAGIYIDEYPSASAGVMTIGEDVEFSSNIASSDGGGLYYSAKSVLDLNGTFKANIAKDKGGAFFANEKCTIINIEQCKMSENIAKYGGAVSLISPEADVVPKLNIALGEPIQNDQTKCEFRSNKATHCGGSIYLENVELRTNDFDLAFSYVGYNEIVGSKEDYALQSDKGKGGGIYISGASSYVEIGEETYMTDIQVFTRNTLQCGGGLYAENIKQLVFDGVLGGNTSGTGGSYGGGLYINNTELILGENSLIDANLAYTGGGLCAYNSKITINGGTISYNGFSIKDEFGNIIDIETFGGGIYIKNSELIINNIYVKNNFANVGSGLYAESSTINILDGEISYNNSVYGTIYVKEKTDITISSGSITNNDGKGIFTQHGTFILKGDTVISNNIGGGVVLQQTKFYMQENAVIEKNTATYGAGIHASLSATVLNLEGGEIKNNKSIDYGAGIMLMGGTINLSGTSIISNQVYVDVSDYDTCNKSSAGRGAGITMNGGVLNMTGGSVSYNSSGGLLDPTHSYYQTHTDKEVIGEPYGGGIYVNNGAVVNMSGGTISYNIASPNHLKSAGGNIFVTHESDFNMTGGVIGGDGVSIQARIGGGLFNMGETSIAGTITGCVAQIGGGIASCGGTDYMGVDYPVSLILNNNSVYSCVATFAPNVFTANDITIDYIGDGVSHFDIVLSATQAANGYSEIIPELTISGKEIKTDLNIAYCLGEFLMEDGEVYSYGVVSQSQEFVFERHLYNFDLLPFLKPIIFSNNPVVNCEKVIVSGAQIGCCITAYDEGDFILVSEEETLTERKIKKITNHGHEEYISFPGKYIGGLYPEWDDTSRSVQLSNYVITVPKYFDAEALIAHEFKYFSFESDGMDEIYVAHYEGYKTVLDYVIVGGCPKTDIGPITSSSEDLNLSVLWGEGWGSSCYAYLPASTLYITFIMYGEDTYEYYEAQYIEVYVNDKFIVSEANIDTANDKKVTVEIEIKEDLEIVVYGHMEVVYIGDIE